MEDNTKAICDGNVGGDGVHDLAEICRERRQRRIESRRRRRSSPPSSGEELEVAEEVVKLPEVGVMTVAGRMREMEDAVRVCMELCRPEINGLRQPVHFFAVYDGHGGDHVASLCRERLHVLLQEELMRNWARDERENGRVGVAVEDVWRTVMKKAFDRMDQLALTTCPCGATGFACGCHPVTVALSGSTATVAVVTADHIITANCGDSRAVLCRGSRVVPLTFDHKPDRPDELARIEAAGGRVIFLKGARVQGILAMSRAIGDKFLKPLVISEPDTTITRRDEEDECLILASDGLWDVISSELACMVAGQCLREGRSRAPTSGVVPSTERDDMGPMLPYPSQSALAAALLTRLALGRESSDNISVIVVDLKSR